MTIDKIIEILSYTLPSAVTGLVAYFFFLNHTKNEEKKLKLSIIKENQKHSLPIKMQAYERMTLYLERINPSNLMLRVKSINNDKSAYAQSVLNTIEQEFEHNISQQIYISEECWSVIISAKNAIKQLVLKEEKNTSVKDAQELREAVLKEILKKTSPSISAMTFVKDEVKGLI